MKPAALTPRRAFSMTEGEAMEPKRPWWRKKRWAAAMLLWLFAVTIIYPLSNGPYDYCLGRQWISASTWERCRVIYVPVEKALVWSGRTDLYYEWCAYCQRWCDAGYRHHAGLP
jgi:hypothetical protein